MQYEFLDKSVNVNEIREKKWGYMEQGVVWLIKYN